MVGLENRSHMQNLTKMVNSGDIARNTEEKEDWNLLYRSCDEPHTDFITFMQYSEKRIRNVISLLALACIQTFTDH